MARGIRRQAIFLDETDFQIFLLGLADAREKFGITIHAYCLMTNHIHILMETNQTEIGIIMKRLLNLYAMSFNHRHKFSGHLFEGRYKSCLVKDDQYFLQTSRYIHLNPLKAHMVMKAEEYKWSSYRTYLKMADDRGLTSLDKTLRYFKNQDPKRYQEFVEDIGHKYKVEEEEIHKEVEEDEIWLPW